MQTQKPGKRIVSKSEYVQKRLLSVTTRVIGIAVQIFALIWIVAAPYECYLHIDTFQNDPKSNICMFLILVMAIIVGGGLFAFWEAGLGLVEHAAKIDPGLPLTRANTADLPANDSLVRASQEPAQVQESVLLRAASQTQEQHEQQLLRASAGKQKEY